MASKKKVAFGTSAGIAAAVAVILGGVYKDEGGYVNHPNDPGGETNMGITIGVARDAGWGGVMKAFPKQCDTEADVCADRIYYERYMVEPGFVPVIIADPAVGEELVNSAVNFGKARPSRWFQQSINELCGTKLAVDGKVGAQTVLAFKQCMVNRGRPRLCVAMLDRLDAKQRAEYDRLVRVNPGLKVFYKGWVNKRIGNVDRAKCGVAA
ncbi:MAG: secretion activating protein [Sphingobium sp.]|nr:secretion activating protein [Sphingobium sp.]